MYFKLSFKQHYLLPTVIPHGSGVSRLWVEALIEGSYVSSTWDDWSFSSTSLSFFPFIWLGEEEKTNHVM